MYALEALSAMKSGEILEVITDCPQSFASLPEEVVAHGHRLVVQPIKEGPMMRFYVRAK
ncbi:sulfurtransferase TusA family protein [Effusibacillus pohliae]|uniref:sulfurtransferase TusA family protein n=1 Tax=Effusibacillus pohliae TaxID=232270 RepID=UPI00037A264A|nr:sulfurtransferase TusA family protein [Effusibacillus pohliae]